MSSGNTDNIDWTCVASPELEGKPTNSIQVQIAKFDEQSRRRQEHLMKQVAKQEARRLAEEAARKKAEEEARRVAKEKWKAEEEAKVRADFEARCKAEVEVRAREKAESLVAGEAMRAQLGQGAKPKVRGILILY